VIENVMLEMMYEVPSRKDITEITITREMVEKGGHAFEGKLADPIPAAPRPVAEPNPRRESA